jgi:hypothetical protein
MGTLSIPPKPTGQLDSGGTAQSFVSVLVNPPAPAPEKIYELHEFDPDGIATGTIKLDQIAIDAATFERNSNGTVIIDKNKNLDIQKTRIALVVSKTSNVKFNQVIDTVIQEFTEDLDSTLAFLENKVASLESGTQRNRADKAALDAQIKELNKQIASLKEQLALAVDPGRNNIVSDTLVAGSELYSNQTGANGGQVKNMLLSRNRMAKGVIQENGAFKITTGTYDINGRPLGPETVIWERGKDGQLDINGKFVIFKLGGNGNGWLENLRVNYAKAPVYVRTWGVGGSISSKAKVQLTDSGILNLYDNNAVIWSSYGVIPAIDANPTQIDSRNAAGVGSSAGGTGQTGPVTVAAPTSVRVNWKLDISGWNDRFDTFKIEVGDASASNFTTKFNLIGGSKDLAKQLDPNTTNDIITGYFIVPVNSTYKITRDFSLAYGPDNQFVQLTANGVIVASAEWVAPKDASEAITRLTTRTTTSELKTILGRLTGQAANASEINITSLKTGVPAVSSGSGSGGGSTPSSSGAPAATPSVPTYTPPPPQPTTAQQLAARAAAAASGVGRRR